MKRCWAACLVFLFTTLAVADEPAAPKAGHDSSSALATREGFIAHLNAGVDVHRWLNTNSEARIVPGFGVTADYFLSEVFGVYVSADYVNRGISVASRTATSTWLDLGLGAALRYRGNLFSSTSVNFMQAGAVFAIPFGDFSGTLPMTGLSATSKMFVGFHLQGSSAYPIGGGMHLGPTSWIKFGLGNPVSGETVSLWFTHVGLGAQLTF